MLADGLNTAGEPNVPDHPHPMTCSCGGLGPQLTVWVNGQEIGRFTDEFVASDEPNDVGDVGVFASGALTHVLVEQFAVQRPG